ncbi:AAA family ATPase [Planctomicrobium sp.]|nr:AAA family ATPase [Planctomicrobium sp.]MDB4733233.1 AAA family ATPase [Planctomicrobium sp.]
MYEGFFGLKKRPFSAVPNTDSFVALEPTQEVLDDLLICLVQSRGIAVVTSFAGLGKTLLCKQVAESADNRFQTVYLSTSAFSTRRALLQAILYEFGIHYEGLSEQEARLKILEAARAIAKEGRLLLIIVDEAHLLNSRLFEELRTLSDYAPEGEALVRLILSGQFELEEKLADPAMSAVHQRIGCQVTLEPLSLGDSASLIKERLRISGVNDIGTVLSEPALEAICRASDGNARCLCQLADHSLLLAFAEEQKPVQRETVLAALDDLKELPLHWNELSAEETSYTSPVPREIESVEMEPEYNDVETDEFEIPESLHQEAERSFVLHLPEEEEQSEDDTLAVEEDGTVIEYSVFEVGADIGSSSQDEPLPVEVPLTPEPQIEQVMSLDQLSSAATDNLVEEVIIDKYAALDRVKESSVDQVSEPHAEETRRVQDSPESHAIDEAELLETINSLRQEIGPVVDESKARYESQRADEDLEVESRLDVVEPESAPEASSSIESSKVIEPANGTSDSEQESTQRVHAQEESNIRFAQLFTRLSQRRRKLKQQRVAR